MKYKCDKCGLHKTSYVDDIHKTCIMGEGPEKADIMIVGRDPSAFIEDAGQLLNSLFEIVGIKRKGVYISSVMKCRLLRNKKPGKKEIEICRAYLEQEIKEVKPRVMCVLGNVALNTILGKTGIKSIRGNVFWSDKYKCNVVPTYHPSYLVKFPEVTKYKEDAVKDLKLVKELSTATKSREKSEKVRVIVVDTVSRLKKVIEKCRSAEKISFDLETSGFAWRRDKILCMSLAYDRNFAYVIPVYLPIIREHIPKDATIPIKEVTGYKLFWKEKEIKNVLKEILGSKAIKIAQKGKFDIKFLKAFGISVNNFLFDTYLAHFILDETSQSHKLESLVWQYKETVGIAKYKEVFRKKYGGVSTFALIPPDELYEYSGYDAIAEFRLAGIFAEQLKKDKLELVFYKIIMPLVKPLMDMEWRGVRIDTAYLESVSKKYAEKLDRLRFKLNGFPALEQFKRERGVEEFNMNSPMQLSDFLFNYLRLPAYKKTKTGSGYSVDAKVIKKLKNKHPFVKLLAAYKKLQKFNSTYLKGLPKHIQSDGRIHTEYDAAGSRTGRPISRNPNLQNIPKKDKVLCKVIRDAFVSTEGYSFLGVDYRQIEYRCLAHYSNDPQMLEDIKNGVDIHREMASVLCKKSVDLISDSERAAAKSVVFGIMYGRGALSIAEEFGMSVKAAQNTIDAFFKKYPAAKKYIDGIKLHAEKYGEVRNAFGRRRFIPNAKSNDRIKRAFGLRQATNTPIQAMATDIVSIKTSQIWRALRKFKLDAYLVMTVHDELLAEINDKEFNKTARLIKTVMEKPIKGLRFSLQVEIKKGKRYGSLSSFSV